jgi:foldase protein PrsA
MIAAQMVIASPPQSQKKSVPGKSEQLKKGEVDPSALAKTASAPPVVAKVNGEDITYKALAEEVIARKGAEVLDTMISRLLVEQACRQQGIKITAQEINDEIMRTAERFNMTPEKYFAMLQERKGMTPQQYQRDIVWPGLALKRMARKNVKVTDDDIEKGFEAFYGEKVRCRWIMLNDQRTAMKVWNELKDSDTKNKGKVDINEFARQVTLWSVDTGSRSIGGQLQPIGRHTSPAFENIERAAFALKEDGEISPVVQFGAAYVILYREGRVPASGVKLEDVRGKIEAEIYEAKIRDQIEQVFGEIQKGAKIENLLTGEVSSPQDQKTIPAEHTEKSEPAKSSGKVEQPKKPAAPAKR